MGPLATVLIATLLAADPLYQSAQHKFDLIESGRAKPGSTIAFTSSEINAWTRVAVPEAVPRGIRNPRVEFGAETVTGYALIDFLKMREAKGESTNWLMTRLIEGERPVKVSVRIVSAGGRATVYLTSVEISNTVVNQGLLDFLVKTFLIPLYPDAKIDEPFDLGYNIDRIDTDPNGVKVVIKK